MNREKNEYVLEGPLLGCVPDCSLAEYLLPKIKSHPKDQIVQVDSECGVVQTWGEFRRAGFRLAEGLRKMGVKEEDVVGMLCRNSVEASEIVLAAWMCNAIIAPVNGFMKVPELQHILGLTKPKVIFCEEEMVNNVCSALNLLSAASTIVITNKTKEPISPHRTFEEVLVEVDVESYRAKPVRSPSTQLVAILPSSGTCGVSKGVGITHRNFIFQDMNMEHVKGYGEHLDCLQISHFFWVTGMMSFIRTLTTGMKRIFVKNVNAANVLKAIEEHKPKWTLVSPLLLVSISNSPEFDKHDVSSLKLILVGGSPFSASIADKLKGKWDHATFVQSYGTTEASGSLTSGDIKEDVFSVGRVTSGVRLKIADTKTGEALGPNTLGEIRFDSPGAMKGYVRDEEATKESKDPQGWIRTGDLGYYDVSGQVYIVDRIKTLIKVMGMQVAPAEIESVIMSIPEVSEVGVVGVSRDGILDLPAALVVRKANSSVTENDIHAHVQKTLSDYKHLTGGVYFVESLPKTGSGKIQRTQLKMLAQSLFSASSLLGQTERESATKPGADCMCRRAVCP